MPRGASSLPATGTGETLGDIRSSPGHALHPERLHPPNITPLDLSPFVGHKRGMAHGAKSVPNVLTVASDKRSPAGGRAGTHGGRRHGFPFEGLHGRGRVLP